MHGWHSGWTWRSGWSGTNGRGGRRCRHGWLLWHRVRNNWGLGIGDCGWEMKGRSYNPQSDIRNPQSGGGAGHGMIRIIAGDFKGRRLKTPVGDRTRPTADRVREAWFSILQRSLRGARVLDLYAGSGALGFEALSRGAASAAFVEVHRAALTVLRANVKTLDVAERTSIHREDALK